MVLYILLKFNFFVVCCLFPYCHGKCADNHTVYGQNSIDQNSDKLIFISYLQGFSNTTDDSRETTNAVTTEWLWHPDIHWYHPYLNLSSVGPEIWEALHLGVLTQLELANASHAAFKWVALLIPNLTAVDILYKERYEGTGKNMTVCLPVLTGVPYPDWVDRDYILRCEIYTPESVAHVVHLKNMRFLYNREKPMVDVHIGFGTVITGIGVPGKYSFNGHLC